MEQLCEITLEANEPIMGKCDPEAYEHYGPNFGKGYDPEWVSCSYTDKNYDYNGTRIYCFHPAQGHENSIVTEGMIKEATQPCEKDGSDCNGIGQSTQAALPQPKTLPKTGGDAIMPAIMLAIIIITGMIVLDKIKRRQPWHKSQSK